jgi:fatty acid desaturase
MVIGKRDAKLRGPAIPNSADAGETALNTERPPLNEVRKKLRINWYRSPLATDQLRGLALRSNLRGAFQAVGHIGLWACTGALTCYAFTQGAWIAFAVCLFLHGTIGTFLKGIAVHELGHGTVFRTKKLNSLFLRLYSIVGWWNFYDYAMSHTYHHRYTLHPDGDREVVLPRDPSLRLLHLLQLFTINITGGPESTGLIPTVRKTLMTVFNRYEDEWLIALYADQPGERVKAVNWIRFVLLVHVLVAVAAIASGYWIVVIVFSCHMFFGNWLKFFVALPMHCGLRDNIPDFRLCVRSIRLDPISEFLYWHMNWHTEHHMFAAVPCYNLPKLHELVKDDMPVPRTLVGAWREMRETWNRQKDDPDYTFNTPLPSSAHTAVTEVSMVTEGDETDPVVASIGDLAPDALA